MANNTLKDTLVKLGIPQADLAKDSGISEGTINKIANLKRTPAPTTMHRIVRSVNKLANENLGVTDIFPNGPDMED